MKLFRISLFSLIIATLPSKVFAAACCGGGFAMPSVITGDDRAQLTTTYSSSQIDTDVYDSGIWRKRTSYERTQILKIEGSQIFSDRYQYGFSVPVQMREKKGVDGGQSTGLADVSANFGYEYLPDWDYNPWRPRGIGFLSLTLPTGKSVYEFEDGAGLDSRGRGFWALGVGTVLTKSWQRWDANASMEVHHSFSKDIQTSQINGRVTPNNGATWSFGTGYNTKSMRLGGAITWVYEDPIEVEGNVQSEGSIQRYATGALSLSYMPNDHWSTTLSYSDQLLFGNPINTSLSKTVALLIQKRWSR